MKPILAYLLVLLVLFLLLNFNFSQAQIRCPLKTTASYRFITFIGKAGLGGDKSVDAWFEYGVNKDNLKATQKLTLKQDGIYCLRVTKLKPCTTYYYRAVAENSAGINYGELKSIKTLCYVNESSYKANKNKNQGTKNLVIF